MQNMLANLISPHYCCSCGEIGLILCENCKYDIISEPYERCIACGTATSGLSGLCWQCIMPYSRAWCVGDRNGALMEVLKRYKFDRGRAAYWPLAELLDTVVPVLPASTIVVSVPTIRPHIRRRGYDHAALIARSFAKRRNLPYQQLLSRTHNSVQLGASKRERHAQASRAFRAAAGPASPILLIDDVLTTGATAFFAAKALRDVGAEDVFLAVIARQPLEKHVKN